MGISLKEELQKKKEKEAEYQNIESFKAFQKKHETVENYIHDLASTTFKYFDKYFWKDKIQGYKNYVMYNADRKRMLIEKKMDWRTNFKTPLTRIFVDSMYNKLFDAEFSIDVYAATPDGAKGDEGKRPKDSVKALNEWAYINSDIEMNLKKALKDAVATGDGFVRVDMEVPKEYIKLKKDPDSKIPNGGLPLAECTAVAEYVPREEIIFEGKKDFYKSSFYGWRKIESDSRFTARRGHLIKISSEVKDYIKNDNNKNYIFSKNYSSHRNIKQFEDVLISNNYGLIEDDLYNFPNIKNEGETYEHWTDTTLTILRNGYVVYDGENPMGKGNHPFVHFGLGISPNMGMNQGISQLLVGIQELYDLVYNGYSDFLKRHFNPMYMASGQQYLQGFEDGYLTREPYKIISNLGEGKIEKINLGDDVQNGFSMLQYLWNMGGQITGLTRYTGAQIGKGVERSARGSDYQVKISAEVIKPIIFQVNKALNRVSKMRCQLAKNKLPEKSLVSIMGKKGFEEFKTIKIEDLQNDYIIRYKSDSIADYMKERELDNLTSFLNYEKVLGQDPVTNTFIFDQRKIAEKIAELHGLEGSVLTIEEFSNLQLQRGTLQQGIQKELQKNIPQQEQIPEEMLQAAASAENRPQQDSNKTIIEDETL